MRSKWDRLSDWLQGKRQGPDRAQPSLDELVWQAQREVEAATSYFHSVSDPELVDHACHVLEAARRRYSYLLRLVRQEQGKLAG